MTTVRLPLEYEQRLDVLSALKEKTKSELIKEALDIFFHTEDSGISSYESGKMYFGQYGSGRGDLSVSYKKKIKEKLHGTYGSH